MNIIKRAFFAVVDYALRRLTPSAIYGQQMKWGELLFRQAYEFVWQVRMGFPYINSISERERRLNRVRSLDLESMTFEQVIFAAIEMQRGGFPIEWLGPIFLTIQYREGRAPAGVKNMRRAIELFRGEDA